MLKKKKAQADILAFIGLILGLLILAPILYMIVTTTLGEFSSAINTTNPSASASVDLVESSFLGWLDYLILLSFLVNVILLFVFSFLVDTHPLFVLFYILTAMFALIFSPYVLVPIQQIFGMTWFGEAVTNLPLTDFIVTKFSIIILGIIILNGIIMYAKFRTGGVKL